MNYRIIPIGELKVADFYDLPFWINLDDKWVWVSIQHIVENTELVDEIQVQQVIDNVAQRWFIKIPNGVTVKASVIEEISQQMQHDFNYTPPQATWSGDCTEYEPGEPRY